MRNTLITQPLIHGGKRQFNGNAHVVTDPRRRGPRSAAKPVDCNDIRATACDPAGNGGDVMDGCDFTITGFLYCVASFREKHKLSQVFYGINVMVRGGGDGVRALGIMRVLDTSPTILAPGRCPPMPGFAPDPS